MWQKLRHNIIIQHHRWWAGAVLWWQGCCCAGRDQWRTTTPPASVKCWPTTSDEFFCVHQLRPVHLTHCKLTFFLKWLKFSHSSMSCATLLYGKTLFLVHRRQPSSCQPWRNRLPIQMNQRAIDSSQTWHLYWRFLNGLSWIRSLSTLKKPTWWQNFIRFTAITIISSPHSWRVFQTFSTRLTLVR